MSALPPSDWPNRQHSRIVEVSPHRWHVQQMGTGSDALFLHGAGASAHSFDPISSEIQSLYRTFVPDLPGHAHTRSPKGRSKLPLVSSDLGRLLNSENVTPDLVIGHSAGGAIALEMVRQGLIAPRHVVIINGALEDFKGAAGVLFPMIAKVLALNPLTGFFLSSGSQAVSQARSVIRSTGTELPDDKIAPYARLIGQKSHIDGTLAMMSQWSLAELNRALPQIVTPTLFLHGAKDSAVDVSVARRAAAAMPRAELVVLDDVGHLAHEEAPARVAAHILDFAGPGSAN
ncbi:alpha/beta fold hydrolase BchO [Hasllibacter sp. MH4015]|uniref:alpha/beta fold hydrolase BchO n=1 Tax=Hasllibacter sp. MH4015 TaxID=2854029 RepID=UPI001CD7C636|nr:alpha/beta fold hydrolase BchO [Hasllibacter sp. MH4015]